MKTEYGNRELQNRAANTRVNYMGYVSVLFSKMPLISLYVLAPTFDQNLAAPVPLPLTAPRLTG